MEEHQGDGDDDENEDVEGNDEENDDDDDEDDDGDNEVHLAQIAELRAQELRLEAELSKCRFQSKRVSRHIDFLLY